MTAIAFDTLKLAKGLEEAGFAHEQAIKTAEVLSVTIGESVVTREHFDSRLAELEAATKAEIAKLEAASKADIATVKSEIVKWMFGAIVAQTAVIAALVKLL